ncbi:hypothetical protein EYF80_017580 [Liparis tanakae]|uniref:Uncharacterized protein n=1 Tax=Liparis tanakae TaxID=230148 RepID=A0A4Z2I4G7_9TELE|nr:hypothetical protein EYF80_017580 [Liparis tanakae]
MQMNSKRMSNFAKTPRCHKPLPVQRTRQPLDLRPHGQRGVDDHEPEEQSQHKYIDKRDEERGVGVELLLLHEHVCSVTEVEIAHDDAHLAEGLERRLWAQRGDCGRRLLLLEALDVRRRESPVMVVAEDVEDQQGHGRAHEETRRQLLQEVRGRQRLAAGAVDGPEELVAQRVHEHHGALRGSQSGGGRCKPSLDWAMVSSAAWRDAANSLTRDLPFRLLLLSTSTAASLYSSSC